MKLSILKMVVLVSATLGWLTTTGCVVPMDEDEGHAHYEHHEEHHGDMDRDDYPHDRDGEER